MVLNYNFEEDDNMAQTRKISDLGDVMGDVVGATSEQVENEIRNHSIIKIQSHARKFLARCRILKMVNARFEKIYDPKRKAYFYYDMQNDTSSWHKPTILLHADITHIAPTYTRDMAAVIIQRQFHKLRGLRHVRSVYKNTVMAVLDERTGSHYYYNPKTGYTSWELPSFMAGTLDHKDYSISKQKSTSRRNLGNEIKNEDISATEVEDDDGGNDSMASSETSSSADTENSEARREKRKAERKYPR